MGTIVLNTFPSLRGANVLPGPYPFQTRQSIAGNGVEVLCGLCSFHEYQGYIVIKNLPVEVLLQTVALWRNPCSTAVTVLSLSEIMAHVLLREAIRPPFIVRAAK